MLRNSVFDNAKLLMIFLVVFGHFIEPIIDRSEIIKTIYMVIYSFHIPVFVILAGALTKLDVSEEQTMSNIGGLIVPFLVFTILYEIFNFIVTKSISNYTLNWQPYWILWFLFSMFIWKTTLPIICRFKFPFFISVIISLCAGYVSDVGYFLGVSRTLYFFPFFILGYKLGPSVLANKFLVNMPRMLFVSVLILNTIFFWLFRDLPHQWLYGSFSYERLGVVDSSSYIMRSLFYFISFSSSVAILMLMPSGKSAFSARGQNSLFVYVWHGFFVKIAMCFGVMQLLIGISNILALITLFIVAIILTLLLSSVFVADITTRYLLAPFQRLILIKR